MISRWMGICDSYSNYIIICLVLLNKYIYIYTVHRNGMMIPNDFPVFLIRWVEITNQVFGTIMAVVVKIIQGKL